MKCLWVECSIRLLEERTRATIVSYAMTMKRINMRLKELVLRKRDKYEIR